MTSNEVTSLRLNRVEHSGDICSILEFDTALFGMRIGRLGEGELTIARARSALEWCRANGVRCLYYLCPARASESMAIGQRFGFQFVDVRITFAVALEEQRGQADSLSRGTSDTDLVIRPHRSSDVPELQAIAATSYRDTRFYQDPRFGSEACDRLYEIWVEKSCQGYADAVLVGDVGGQPAGFVTCHLTREGDGNIGLVGVSERARGRGLGGMLIRSALDWFAERGASRVIVVTQGRNIAAQRLYQRSGFLTDNVELWFHRWFDDERDQSLGR